ncbi:MAG: hypothetical protein HYX63_20100 [Gammaproteobacteria bacterium]|nr:hypothetical protein [Gammaproteobacteria bacterium]
MAVNDAGQVIGYTSTGGFLWDKETFTDLGKFIGSDTSAALWENGILYNINSLLDLNDPLANLVISLRDAVAINDSEQLLVGGAIRDPINPSIIRSTSLLLTLVPLPAAFYFLGSGLVGLAGLAFRRNTRT